jgi:flagellar hook protein FlgE
MLDSIYVAASGLNGHQKALKLISNNVSNMNTPGFKGSNSQFTDVFLQESGDAGNGQDLTPGGGLDALVPTVNFAAGEISSTGRDLDMALDGPGFFVVKDGRGEQLYTKAGRFEFNADGRLVTMDGGDEVLGHASDDSQSLAPITIGNLRTSAFAATTKVTFSGNLSSTAGSTTTQGPDHTIDAVTVYDSLGTAHTLSIQFTVKRVTTQTDPADPTTSSTSLEPGTWEVNVLEGTTSIGTGEFKFANAVSDLTVDRFAVTLTAFDKSTSAIELVLGDKVTHNSGGSTSSLVKQTVDGNAAGTLTKAVIDSTGELVVTYTNTLTAKGPKIAVAEFASPSELTRASGAKFAYEGRDPLRFAKLGDTTKLVSTSLELSNVDLTEQFSSMILIQRGFQASSQVLSTASEMIQSLYDLKSHR